MGLAATEEKGQKGKEDRGKNCKKKLNRFPDISKAESRTGKVDRRSAWYSALISLDAKLSEIWGLTVQENIHLRVAVGSETF